MPALHINPFHQQKKMEKKIFANTLGDDCVEASLKQKSEIRTFIENAQNSARKSTFVFSYC